MTFPLCTQYQWAICPKLTIIYDVGPLLMGHSPIIAAPIKFIGGNIPADLF